MSYQDFQQRVYSYLIKYKKENLKIIDKGTSAHGVEHDCLLPKWREGTGICHSTLLVSYTCPCVIYEAMAQAAAHKLIRHIPSHYDHEEQY